MSIFGIGPSLAVAGGTAALLVCLLQRLFGFSIPIADSYLMGVRILGLCWGVVGLWLWVDSMVLVIRGHRSHKLMTVGVYRYSRNPMYAAFIIFLVPAISFLWGDLLILLVSGIMYVTFKILIRKEEKLLKREFGEEYERYTRQAAQLFPFVRVLPVGLTDRCRQLR